MGAHALLEDAAPFDLLFPRVAFSVAWTSSENGTTLTVYGCGTDPACPVPPTPKVASENGSSGTLTFLGSANEYYLLVPEQGAVTLTIIESGPWDGGAPGLGLLLAGLGVSAFGLTGRRRRPAGPGSATGSGRPPADPAGPDRSGQA